MDRSVFAASRAAHRQVALATALTFAVTALGACSSSANDDVGSQRSVDSADSGASEPDDDSGITPTASPAESAGDDCEERSSPRASDDFETVDVEQIGEEDGVSVHAAVYPLAETEGNPWSQWGQGTVLPDGRFISAVGDHLGEDGTSWIYEYDPEQRTLTRTVEVSEGLDHIDGDWGYGKVHAPMVLGECGDVIAATYWGTRRDLELGESYRGDQLFRYDPFEREIEALGAPVEGFGIPSIAISPDGRWIFGEAVDPGSETDRDEGVFFVADAESGEVVLVDDNPDHVGFRSVMVTANGLGMYAVGDGGVMTVDPVSGDTEELTDVLPGEWLRAATQPGPDGTTFGATREPDALFSVSSNGEFAELLELDDYVASMSLSPDGSTVYYVPGAHGNAYVEGTPLIAYDVESGTERVVVLLNEMIENALGVRAGGSYNVVADPSGQRVFIGLNSGPIDDNEDAFGEVVLAVVEFD